MSKTKGLLFAVAAAAMAFTLSCGDGPNDPPLGNEAGEKPENFAGKTNDGHDLLVFQQGDLDEILFKTDTVYITDTTFLGRLHFRNLPDSKTPAPGDIINSAIAKKAPYGFLYRVAEVAKEEGGVTIVSVSYASLAEAVENLDIEFLVPLVYEDEDGADGQVGQVLARGWFKNLIKKVVNTVVAIVETVVDVLSGNWEAGGTEKLTIKVVDKKAPLANFGEVKLNGEYVMALNMKLKIKSYSLDYAKMSVAQNKDLKLEGNLKGKINYKYEHDLAHFALPDISFMAGPVYVYLFNTGIVKAKVEAEAEAKISAELAFKEYSEFGFEYTGGHWNKIDICEKDFGFDYKHSIYGSARLGVLVGFRSLFYGVGGLEVSAGPSLVLKTPDLSNLSANSNLSLDMDLDVDMKVHFQFLDWLKKSYNFVPTRTPLGNLSRSKILSTFDSLVVSTYGVSYAELKSSIERPSLGFQVENYGVCVGTTADHCEKGGGTRQSFGAISDDKKHEFTARFDGLPAGTYYASTYFESGIEGDIHYDKAKVFVVEPTQGDDFFTDTRDGKVYRITKIGNQTWMAQNLNYDAVGSVCYGEGSEVAIGWDENDNRIMKTLTPAEVQANCTKYGRLYGLETSKIACPAGWHLPSNSEWEVLLNFADGNNMMAGKNLRATNGWEENCIRYDGNPCEDVNGVDKYGFAALPGGEYYNYNNYPYGNSYFQEGGIGGYWWIAITGDIDGETNAYTITSSLSGHGWTTGFNSIMHRSVRCLKD